ncbi:hypothetical protein ACTFIV_010636 [Dictyostelium citrinum]
MEKTKINSNDLKVLINNFETVPLFKIDQDENQDVTLKKINSSRPVGYHQFCFDSKLNKYKSIDKGDSIENQSEELECNPYLYSKNIKFVHERAMEMCYICRDKDIPSVCLWSWDFGKKLEISKLILNMLFMTFEENSGVDWYLSTEISNDMVLALRNKNYEKIMNKIQDEFLKLPLELVSPVYFDKKLNLTELVGGSKKFYLSCIMSNTGSPYKTQLFRSKFLTKFTQEDDDYLHLHTPPKFNYPFNIYFEVSLSNNIKDYQEETLDFNGKQKNNYYFIEIDENIDTLQDNNSYKTMNWDSVRVGDWLFDMGFYDLIERFSYQNINGETLLTRGLSILPNNFLQNTTKRNKYIESLNRLLSLNKMNLILSPQQLQQQLLQLQQQQQQLQQLQQLQLQDDNNNNNNNIQPIEQPIASADDQNNLVPTANASPLYSNQYSDKSILFLNYLDEKEKKQLNSNNNNNKLPDESSKNQLNLDDTTKLKLNDISSSNYKLIIKNNVIHVHKLVLSQNSDYFNALFTSNFCENLNSTCTFETDDEKLTIESLELLMKFIYLQSQEEALKFLKQQDFKQLKALLHLSDRFLFKQKELIEKFVVWSINSVNLKIIDQEFNNNNLISLFTKYYLNH